ncbi:alpha/beta hydrolase [Sphingomonas sp.]|uniref:alpha/beta fold hydrolase n=1 Tax=Sphingomonas sp. TaxID=28214 RepID=UPI002ED93F8C
MPIFLFLRFIFALLSLVILALAGYFLWEWYQGDPLRDADGVIRRHREDWRLWLGAALLAWSLFGRFVTRLLLAKGDTDPTHATRGKGRTIQSETGATIYLEEYGAVTAQPIVLTHGWSMDSTIWNYAKRDLAKNFRVLVWDLPGLGLSQRDDSEICLSGFARDLKSVMAQVGDQRPILVGHSIGGMIIQTLARDDPQAFKKVAGVALFNTTYTNPLKTMILSGLLQALRKPLIVPMLYLTIWLAPLVWLASWQSYLSGSTHISARFGFGRFVTRSQLDHVALLLTRAWPAVSARGDLAMIRWDGSAGMPNLTVPALVLGGGVDIVTKAEASETIAHRFPGAQLEIIEGVNHMGPVERSDLYNARLAAFAEA